jgi:Fe-S-cluster containining protein
MNDIFGKQLDWGTHDGMPPRGGHCCRGFALQHAFLDYDASYRSAVAGGATYIRQDGVEVPNIADVLTVGPAIRLVGVVDRNPFDADATRCQPRKVWRCVHCREDNGFLCNIYDQRPAMCRAYPGNAPSKRCEFTTCQSTHCPAHPDPVGLRFKERDHASPQVE